MRLHFYWYCAVQPASRPKLSWCFLMPAAQSADSSAASPENSQSLTVWHSPPKCAFLRGRASIMLSFWSYIEKVPCFSRAKNWSAFFNPQIQRRIFMSPDMEYNKSNKERTRQDYLTNVTGRSRIMFDSPKSAHLDKI